jgi:hypothetical protein
MAQGRGSLYSKWLAVLLASLGFVICIVFAAMLAARMLGPGSFQATQGLTGLLVALGVLPDSALGQAQPFIRVANQGARAQRSGRGVAGAAARDATDRPSIPGWDPVLRASARDLALLDPDDAIDRALGIPRRDGVGALAAALPRPLPAPAATGGVTVPAAAAAPAVQASPGGVPLAKHTLPSLGGAQSQVYAVEFAFFLDAQEAALYAIVLAGQSVEVRLVEQTDQSGRTWTYVRSPVFTDSLPALLYAERIERILGVPATLTTEPRPVAAPTAASAPVLAPSPAANAQRDAGR